MALARLDDFINIKIAHSLSLKIFRIVVRESITHKTRKGTGFICEVNSKMYFGTACHVFDIYNEVRKEENKEKTNEELIQIIISEIKSVIKNGEINIYLDRRIKTEPPQCQEDIDLNYLTLDIQNFILMDSHGDFPGAIIQPNENVDIALFPIGKTITVPGDEFKDEKDRAISSEELAIPIHVTARAFEGKVLILQFPGSKWIERPRSSDQRKRRNNDVAFDLGFSIGNINSDDNKKGMFHIYHTASTLAGSSGSPLIQFISDCPYLIAVHTRGGPNRAQKLNGLKEDDDTSIPLNSCSVLPKIFDELLKSSASDNNKNISDETAIHEKSLDEISLGFKLMELSDSNGYHEDFFDLSFKPADAPKEYSYETEEYRNNVKFPIFPFELYYNALDSVCFIEYKNEYIGIGCFCKINGKVGLLIQNAIKINDPKISKEEVLENSYLVYHLLSTSHSRTRYKEIIDENITEEITCFKDIINFFIIPHEKLMQLALSCIEIGLKIPLKTSTIVIGCANNSAAFQTIVIKDYSHIVEQNKLTICGKLTYEKTAITFNKNVLSLLFQLDGNKKFYLVGFINTIKLDKPSAYYLRVCNIA